MIWLKLAGDLCKIVLILGLIEYIAPGFGYQVAYKSTNVLMNMWMGGQ